MNTTLSGARRPPIALCCWLVGCAAVRAPTPAPTPPSAATAAPAAMNPGNIGVQLEAWGANGPRPIESGDTLRSGDRVALKINVDRPTYVYALAAGPRGTVQTLFPVSGDVLVPPGEQRVPPLGQWLRLDQRPGRESLFVMAQPTPMSAPEREARVRAELARTPSISDALGCAPVRPPASDPAPGSAAARGHRYRAPA